ncbi:MAG: IS110 family transposase [Phycisphaeraceae bacterium]|jgi:transposase|nr:IS110 family transposase [Phycisphaeraceae bacterium]
MESVPIFVGLDYHSGSVQACVVDAAGKVLLNSKRASSVPDVVSVVQSLGHVQRVAIEACCGAADFGDHLAHATGWRVSLSHPGLVSKMRSSIDKSDRSDARVLADLCRTGYLPGVWLPPEPIRELRTLTRRRHQLTDAIRRAKTRIGALLRDKRVATPPEIVTKWTLRHVAWLKALTLPPCARIVLDDLLAEIHYHAQRRDTIDAQLEQATAGDAMIARLRQVKGIGPVTAWTLRAVIGRFDRFRNGKQLSRSCGLTPKNASSGERVADAGLVRAGDPTLKTVLIQVAQRVVRCAGEWNSLYLGLLERGKPACVAIAAVANRWTRRLWHDLKGMGDGGGMSAAA